MVFICEINFYFNQLLKPFLQQFSVLTLFFLTPLASFKDKVGNRKERVSVMKRQKRNRQDRAHTRGYQAGISGRSKEHCPYQSTTIKSQWLGGWREAIEDKQQGLFM